MAEKILIFDSSTLINLSMNGLTDLFYELKRLFNGKFLITKDVKYETIDHPMMIKKFELGALKIGTLLRDEVLEMPSSLKISDEEVRAKTREILQATNHSFFARNEFIHIIDDGEASCLALSMIAEKKGIESVIAIDERTTRMLGESPENLRKLFESKLHTQVEMKQDASFLKDIRFIRSSELVYVAWKKGAIDIGNGQLLDALLYATKFKGNSISRNEIEEIKRIARR